MEAIKTGEFLRSISTLLHLTRHIHPHAGSSPACSRMPNSCMSPSYAAHGCPYWAGVLASRLLPAACSCAGLGHYWVTSFPQATHAITLSGEDHFGQPWQPGIHRWAVERREGAAPDGSSDSPGCPALWLGQPWERQRPSAEPHSSSHQISLGRCWESQPPGTHRVRAETHMTWSPVQAELPKGTSIQWERSSGYKEQIYTMCISTQTAEYENTSQLRSVSLWC